MRRTLQHEVKPERPLTQASLIGDLIQRNNPLFGAVWINPQRMSGAPCFTGTRVPIKALFDYLEGGDSIDHFLEGFPGVTRDQAIAVLEFARRRSNRISGSKRWRKKAAESSLK